ncbi:skin secretory protein xP2-like [Nilaparvata lugens]|uniref:skin secretory protein xP2-like n=1 Tax=Nilaparvata lugens TaxID=108931 RepID=UPI00193C95FE|nr:skin secretory protein xP2-like [Nilaparvata lugens]
MSQIYILLLSMAVVGSRAQFFTPTSTSFSSSVSIPGQQPLVYTHQTGAGGASALATAQHPNGSVSQVGSISGPHRRSPFDRDDSSQQRIQSAPPPSLFQPVNFVSPNAPAPLISAASSAQAAAPAPPPGGVTSASAGSQFSASAQQQFAPSSEYGPPAEAGALVGAFAQAAAAAKAPEPILVRVPASEYGLPGTLVVSKGASRSPPVAASESSSLEHLVFVPAFAPAPEGSPQAAAPPPISSSGFFPPEGALLAPPAPGPSPRETPSRRIRF